MRTTAAALCLVFLACGEGAAAKPLPVDRVAAPQPGPRDDCLASLPADRFAAVGRALCAELQQHRVPGAAVAIAVDGRLAWTFATGRRCQSEEDRVTPDTRFRVGSLTKLLTAGLAVELANSGEIDLGAPVTTYLPDLQIRGGPPPTLRDLLLQRSGLEERDVSPGQTAATVESLGPWTLRNPGSYRYTNAAYAMAGAALERAAGVDYATLVRTRLAAPASLDSVAVATGEEVEGAACGHSSLGQTFTVALDFQQLAHGARWSAPAGAAVASATDLVRLALATGPEGPLSHLRALWTSTSPTSDGDDYGMGVRVRALDEATLVHHAGDTGTFFAELYWIPERGFAVAVVANRARPLRATLTAALSLHDPTLTP